MNSDVTASAINKVRYTVAILIAAIQAAQASSSSSAFACFRSAVSKPSVKRS